jgi:hypothetical protein
VNGTTVLHDLDIWSEAGFAHALKKTVTARAVGGKLVISFPRVASYEAIISGIAISTTNPKQVSAGSVQKDEWIGDLQVLDRDNAERYSVQSYVDNGNRQYGDDSALLAGVPASLLGSTWIRTASRSRVFQGPALLRFTPSVDAEVYVAHDKAAKRPAWLSGWEDTKLECAGIGSEPKLAPENRGREPGAAPFTSFHLYRKRFAAGQQVELGANGEGAMYSVFVTRSLPSPLTQQTKRKKTLYPASRAISRGNSIRWKINVGLNGKYRLTFRYSLAGSTPYEATVKLLDHLGNVVVTMPVHFGPTAVGARGETRVKTAASINAGDFDVVLSLPSANGMAMDSLTVE